MVKKKGFAAALTVIMLAAGTAAATAENAGLQTASAVSDFSYYISGTDVVVSYDGNIEMGYDEDTNVIIGVYDNGTLMNMKITNVNANKQSYSMDGDMAIHLSKEPENITVKMFVWSDDGKIIPKKDAIAAAEMDTVSFKAANVTEFDYPEKKLIADKTKYTINDNSALYVNGTDTGTVTDDNINKYIFDNFGGSVTLVDFDSNGVYDRICVDYYVTAVVDSVIKTSSGSRIYFKIDDSYYGKMQWSADADVTFVKDGKKIAASELNENDVLSIKYDVVNNTDLTDLDFYYVLVSSESLTGTVTSRDSNENIVRINIEEYNCLDYINASDFELNVDYTVHFDSFGKVAYFEEGISHKMYGIIIGMYQQAGNENPIVKLITADNEIVSYECISSWRADIFYDYATGTTHGYQDGGFTMEDIADRISSGQTVCEYSLTTDEKIRLFHQFDGVGGNNLTYNKYSNKLSAYQMSDTVTKIINMDEYMSGDSDSVYAMNTSDFEDYAEYTAYLFDKNRDGSYRFVIVLNGTNAIRPTAALAVVQNVVGTVDVEGKKCTRLMIAQNGEENIELYIEGDETDLKEGSVFAYTKGHAAYVKQSNVYRIMTPDESYDSETSKLMEHEWFSDGLESVTDGRFMGAKAKQIYYDGTPTYKDCYLYFGPVHFKNDKRLEILTGQNSGLTDLNNEIEDFTINDSTLSYVYDYSKNPGDRVSVGALRNSPYIRFNSAYTDDDMLSWALASENNVQPDYALAKIVDGTLTELISFIAPNYNPPQESEKPNNEFSYGVITSFYQNENGDKEINLAADDGNLITLNVVHEDLAAKLTQIVDPGGNTDSNGDGAYSKNEIASVTGMQNTVIKYTTSDNILETAEKLEPKGGENILYREELGMFERYPVSDETTKLIDIDVRPDNANMYTESLQLSIFMDYQDYTAYFYDKNVNGDYRFCIVLEGIATVRADDTIAIVSQVVGTTTLDGITCTVLTIAKDGMDEVSIWVEGDDVDVADGDVIAYAVNSKGYVEKSKLHKIFDAYSIYSEMLKNTLTKDNFTEILNPAETRIISDGKYAGFATPSYASSDSKDVVLYFGPVYRKHANSLELFTVQKNGMSSVLNSQDFSTAGANSYVYDFGAQPRYRVSTGTFNQSTAIFNVAYSNYDKDNIVWSSVLDESIEPMFALVKEIDGDVLDVVYYVAP